MCPARWLTGMTSPSLMASVNIGRNNLIFLTWRGPPAISGSVIPSGFFSSRRTTLLSPGFAGVAAAFLGFACTGGRVGVSDATPLSTVSCCVVLSSEFIANSVTFPSCELLATCTFRIVTDCQSPASKWPCQLIYSSGLSVYIVPHVKPELSGAARLGHLTGST